MHLFLLFMTGPHVLGKSTALFCQTCISGFHSVSPAPQILVASTNIPDLPLAMLALIQCVTRPQQTRPFLFHLHQCLCSNGMEEGFYHRLSLSDWSLLPSWLRTRGEQGTSPSFITVLQHQMAVNQDKLVKLSGKQRNNLQIVESWLQWLHWGSSSCSSHLHLSAACRVIPETRIWPTD